MRWRRFLRQGLRPIRGRSDLGRRLRGGGVSYFIAGEQRNEGVICSHSYDGNFFTWTDFGTNEWAVGGNPSAQHWSCHLVWDVVRDVEGEVLMCSDMTCVPALGHGTVRIGCIICISKTVSNMIQHEAHWSRFAHRFGEGSNSHYLTCKLDIPGRPRSERQRQPGLPP